MTQDEVGSSQVTQGQTAVRQMDADPRLKAWDPIRKLPLSGNVYTMGTLYLLILLILASTSVHPSYFLSLDFSPHSFAPFPV